MTDQRRGGISWTDETWNVVRGCTRVSEGCRNCYAERVAATRLSGPGQPYAGLAAMTPAGPRWTGRVELVESLVEQPMHWRRPRRVFVNAMSDLFHEGLTDYEIDRVVATMATAHWHTFQVLTKRAGRMADYLTGPDRRERIAAELHRRGRSNVGFAVAPEGISLGDGKVIRRWPLPNVEFGVSAEDQKSLDERLPSLLACREHAAVLWLSVEPLIGPMTLVGGLWKTGPSLNDCAPRPAGLVDWVVVGGESGPDARPMHPEWPRRLRDECAAAGVPFHFKQWGEWGPDDHGEKTCKIVMRHPNSVIDTEAVRMFKAGKKAAGRLLDGKVHNEMPKGAAE